MVGGGMFDYEFLAESLSDEELSDLVDVHTPFYADGELAFFRVKDRIIVAPIEFIFDKAVREAGFSTEELRQTLKDVTDLLGKRMAEDPIKGFTNEEWEALRKARELLAESSTW